MAKHFVDTIVVVYSADSTSEKSARARELISADATLSVQVLNEFLRVSVRKMKNSFETASLALAPIRHACEIVPVTIETHLLAVEIVKFDRIPIFDANIVAAASLAGCEVLYTEDLNHGQRIGGVTIVNPFRKQ